MTDAGIWRLPGPSAFLAGLVPDLEVGDGLIVLEAPTTFDLESLISAVSDASPDLRVEQIDRELARDIGLCGALGEALGVLEPDPNSLEWIEDSIGYGQLALFLLATDLHSDRDREFLARIARSNRTQEPLEFAVVIHAASSAQQMNLSGVRYHIHRWWGAISKLDATVAAALYSPESSEITRACAVEVGAPDLVLVERLIDLDSRDPDLVLDACAFRATELGLPPITVRSGIAADRPSKGDRAGWEQGAIESMDGYIRAHAGVLERPRILRRLWAGQVSSLLPRIDLARLEIIDSVAGSNLNSAVDHDTEIGDLSRILFKSRCRSDLCEAAAWLKNARNLLSHLNLVSDESLRRGETTLRDAGLTF